MKLTCRSTCEVLAVWILATAAALVVAWQTKIGPAIQLTTRHGVHVGDAVALFGLWSLAAIATWRRLSPR